MTSGNAIDRAALSPFHLKVLAFGGGGILCDGYLLGIIGPALHGYSERYSSSAVWSGLLGASSLIGLFLGSLVFGWVTDRIGRRRTYVAILAVFVLASLAHLAVTEVALVFAVRLVLGIAIGADYAVSPSLIAEFAPRRYRGTLLASVSAIWSIGFFAAYAVGALVADSSPDAWRWMLASGAVPALVVGLFRLGCPESPRWLARRGRHDEALAVVRRYLDPDATPADVETESGPGQVSLRTVLQRQYWPRLAVGGGYWFTQVIPLFAVLTFLPSVLASLGSGGGSVAELGSNLFLFAGSAVAIVIVTRWGRRPFILASTGAAVVLAVLLGVLPSAPSSLVVVLLGLFVLVMGCAQVITSIYPSELFPTEIRATGVGLCTSISRIGAATGTFLLPVAIDGMGIHATILIGAAVLLAGLLVAWRWAPETSGQSLDEASDYRTTAGPQIRKPAGT